MILKQYVNLVSGKTGNQKKSQKTISKLKQNFQPLKWSSVVGKTCIVKVYGVQFVKYRENYDCFSENNTFTQLCLKFFKKIFQENMSKNIKKKNH